MEGASPAYDLTLLAGSVMSGAGTLRLEGANRLVLGGDTPWPEGLLDFAGSSSLAGAFQLALGPTGTLRFDHNSTIPGSIAVHGALTLTSSSVTVTIIQTLTLESTGVLNNPGTLQAGAFVNNGGTVNGNSPVVIGLPAPAFAITTIELETVVSQSTSGNPSLLVLAPKTVVLKWIAFPGAEFVVEHSSNLLEWQEIPASVRETTGGHYEAGLYAHDNPQGFFRIRWVQSAAP
jgi:hypothetical protein